MTGNAEIRFFGRAFMAKYDGIVGKALLTVEEKDGEVTLVFADNRYLFVKVENGKLITNSVPE